MIIINNNSSQAFTFFFSSLSLTAHTETGLRKGLRKYIFSSLASETETMPFPIKWATFFFYMIEFKLKVQRFSLGRDELFEIFMMWVICKPCHRFG